MQPGNHGTGSQPTADANLDTVFEGLLSDEPEYGETQETPPTQESPESESATDAEGSTEQPESAQDESTETEETDEEQTEEPSPEVVLDPNLKVKVKIDGQEEEITLAEALKGYSRQADYTRKTQELSSQRKAAEEHITAVRAERERLAANLTELEQALKDATPQEPDWVKMQQENPTEFATEYARWAQYKERMNALKAEKDKAIAQVQQDRAEQVKAHLAAENEKLLAAIPEWKKDPAKAKAEKAKIAEFAQEMGFTEEELSEIRDHRAMILLRDAMKYRELQSKKPVISARIEKVKAATPGSSGQNRTQKTKGQLAKERLGKSGSLDDLAAVFEATVLGD